MVRQCHDCAADYERRRGPGLRCPRCQSEFERERHRRAEEDRRRSKGAQPAVRRRGDPAVARRFDDAWFAGFADGEGCFAVDPTGRPTFALALRGDDSAILLDLRCAFGGSLSWRGHNDGEPYCAWSVSAKADLGGLVAYFDRHPLRAKKRRDYAIWREAVLLYRSHDRNAPALPYLAAVLRHQRGYEPRAEDLQRRLRAVR